MRTHDPARAIEALDLLLESFAGGAHWIKDSFSDGDGKRCLVGALRYVRRRYAITGDCAGLYLADAIAREFIPITWPRWADCVSAFNDSARDFAEIRKIILSARAAAEREAALAAPARLVAA